VNYGSDGLDRMQVACENGNFNVDQGSPDCSSGTQLATYVFDKLQRVTTLQYGSGAPAALVSYTWKTWDDLATLTHTLASSAGTSFTDSYSPAHQILQSTIGNAAYQYASTASATTNYTPNGLNQYATVASQAIVYDANGNLTNDGKYTYTYDPENRLTAAAMTGMSASYLYDPAGRRHQKAVTGGTYAGTTQYLDSGDDEIADYTVSGTTATLLRRYIPGRGVDQPIAIVTAAGVKTYFHQDKTGSVVATSNASGAITEGPYTYDPYGNCLVGGAACSGVNSVAYKYTGRRLDPETGLYYYRARYYDPVHGRFMQTDPVGYAPDMNWYAYVHNDPVDMTDPTGLACDLDFGCQPMFNSQENYGNVAKGVAIALPVTAGVAVAGVAGPTTAVGAIAISAGVGGTVAAAHSSAQGNSAGQVAVDATKGTVTSAMTAAGGKVGGIAGGAGTVSGEMTGAYLGTKAVGGSDTEASVNAVVTGFVGALALPFGSSTSSEAAAITSQAIRSFVKSEVKTDIKSNVPTQQQTQCPGGPNCPRR